MSAAIFPPALLLMECISTDHYFYNAASGTLFSTCFSHWDFEVLVNALLWDGNQAAMRRIIISHTFTKMHKRANIQGILNDIMRLLIMRNVIPTVAILTNHSAPFQSCDMWLHPQGISLAFCLVCLSLCEVLYSRMWLLIWVYFPFSFQGCTESMCGCHPLSGRTF